MLSDFTKLHTFLTIVKEKSFLKAAAKLGISQPAVTQQIKFMEDYLDAKILERKKNGIKLTKEGKQLLTIAQKLNKCIISAEEQLMSIINKNIIYVIGASKVIGDYILPTILNEIKSKINNEVSVDVGFSKEIIEKLLDNKVDLALIESPIFKDGVIYREWMDDEIVIFSNQVIPKRVKNEHLKKFKWVCRDNESHTRKIFKEYLEQAGFIDCDNFNIVTESSSLTTIIQTVLHAPKDKSAPTVSIASLRALKEYVEDGRLFIARLPKVTMKRILYITYSKDKRHDAFTESVISYLMSIK